MRGKFVVVKVTVGLYRFTEPIKSICIDRKQLMLSQIQIRRNRLKCTTDKLELSMAKKEKERKKERKELNALYKIY
ncbi:hypothetical protein [Candidatus Nitrosocosmicus sp. R]